MTARIVCRPAAVRRRVVSGTLTLVLGGSLLAGSEEEAVQREFEIRALARDPATAMSTCRSSLSSPDARRRWAALSGLGRSEAGVRAGVGVHAASCAALLLDPHPDVRAAALRLFGRAFDLGLTSLDERTRGAWLDAVTLSSEHPSPEVRHACAVSIAAWLEAGGEAGATQSDALFELAFDMDERVAGAARSASYRLARRVPELMQRTHERTLVLARRAGERQVSGAWNDAAEPLFDTAPGAAALGALRGLATSPAEAALVELLASRSGGEVDREQLQGGWVGPAGEEDSPRARLLATGLCDDVLGGRLLAELVAGGRPQRELEQLARGAAWNADRDVLLSQLDALPEALALEIMLELSARPADLPVAALAPERLAAWPEALRELAFESVGGVFLESGDVERGVWLRSLFPLVEERVEPAAAGLEELFEDTFGLVARAPLGAGLSPQARTARLDWLFAAWSSCAAEERLRWLGELPRKQRLDSFREELLALVQDGLRSPRMVELLAPFQGDDEVAATLTDALDAESRALAVVLGESTALVREVAPVDGRVMACAAALARVAGGDAVPRLHRLLWRFVNVSWPADYDAGVTERAIALLGLTPEGRAALAEIRPDDLPLRERVERALALARDDAGVREQAWASAGDGLLEDYSECGPVLRARMLAALGTREHRAGVAFLESKAGGPGTAIDEGLAAISALSGLASPAAVDALVRVVVDESGSTSVELRRAAVFALGAEGLADSSINESLTGAWRALVAERSWAEGDDHLLSEELIVALARLAPRDSPGFEHLFTRPLASAADDLDRRFRGRKLADVHFRWRAEIGVARALAAAGALSEALSSSGAWERADARLLLAMGQAAEAEPAARLALVSAAAAALDGEGRVPDGGQAQVDANLEGLTVALSQGASGSALWHAGRLRELARGDARRALDVRLGERDARSRRDPMASLNAMVLQARARLALERGDGAGARELATEAAIHARVSARASRAQSSLEADLR